VVLSSTWRAAGCGAERCGKLSWKPNRYPTSPTQYGQGKDSRTPFHGGDDKFIPSEQIEAFKEEMKSAGAEF